MAAGNEAWLSLLPDDPRQALLESDEPSARFLTITAVLGLPEHDEQARAAREAAVADPVVRSLVEKLPDWESDFRFGGHNSPAFPPNLLRLLHGLGVRAGDYPALERMLDGMLRHQAEDGRFLTSGGAPWSSLPCDHFAVTEVLLLFGRRDSPGITPALARIRDTFSQTVQGPAWFCLPDPAVKWRGPGRKGDGCLQVTVEALRLFGLLPESERPDNISGAAKTLLRAWRVRHEEKPYMFGHGPRFAAGKWPPGWYDASAVLEALAPYRDVWFGVTAAEEDIRSAAEIVGALAACFGPGGFITPRSCFRGFEEYSFGQKKAASPWATARICGLLRAFTDIADIAAGS
jgi:hypothetical protein